MQNLLFRLQSLFVGVREYPWGENQVKQECAEKCDVHSWIVTLTDGEDITFFALL